jgi:pimeloyl-ACP methyl ester carboxylesterase
MTSATARVPAKINLCLGVGGLRDDGYHSLATVYQAVDVFDEVRAEALPDSDAIEVSVHFDSTAESIIVPTGPENLARIVRWGVASDRAVTSDVMAEVMVTDLRNDMHRIEAPVDVIYAWDQTNHSSRMGLDQVYSSSYGGLRNGRKQRIDDARHYVMFDQPEIFYSAVREWLAR